MAHILAPAVRRARRSSPALRATVRALAGATVAAAIAVPLARKRLRMPAWATAATVAAGLLAIAVLSPRTKTRDVVLFTFQMWAFTIAHELPYDDPDGLRRRLRIRYPITADRVLGAGERPTSACSARSAAPAASPRSTGCSRSCTGSGSSSPWCCSSRRARRPLPRARGRWPPPTTWAARSTTRCPPHRRGGPPSRAT